MADLDSRTVKLRSSDEREFDVPYAVAKMSVTIKNMIEDLGLQDDDTAIPLPNVSGAILEKVIKFATHHKDDPPQTEEQQNETRDQELTGFDADFVKDVDQGTLFEMILAANFLDIKSMLDVTCKHVAFQIKGKTPEEIRQHFNIKNDFTPQEEEQVKKENSWCEEKP